MRRALTIAVAVLATAATAAPALAAQPRTNLADVEHDVMCVLCQVPLEVAGDAPQAQAERRFIRKLIAQGKTKGQIEDALVAQYGSAVLALPKADGWSATAYVIPALVALAAAALLAVLLPRGRRRTRGAPAAAATAAPLPKEDAERLDEELARFRG